MSGLYIAYFITERRLEASTFRKTIAYSWSCWIVDNACDCTFISTNGSSKKFLMSLHSTTNAAGNSGRWFRTFLANDVSWTSGNPALKLMNNICPLLSLWSSRSTTFLSWSIKSLLSKHISCSDRFLRIALGLQMTEKICSTDSSYRVETICCRDSFPCLIQNLMDAIQLSLPAWWAPKKKSFSSFYSQSTFQRTDSFKHCNQF